MLKYVTIKPKVYIEPTVISHLVARPSDDAILASWQRASRQLWEDYTDKFEFVISRIVHAEIQRGDPTAARQRLEMVSRLRILDPFPEADILAQKLLDAGAVPRNSLTDAQHIAIATVHSVEYLASWNHKHIVNENKREYINQVCQAAGFQPITICTPVELMEDIQMKEIPEKYMFRNATKDDLDKVAALYRDWVSEASTGGLVVDTVDDLLCRLGPHFRYFL